MAVTKPGSGLTSYVDKNIADIRGENDIGKAIIFYTGTFASGLLGIAINTGINIHVNNAGLWGIGTGIFAWVLGTYISAKVAAKV